MSGHDKNPSRPLTQLPDDLPVLPIWGCVLLPHARLPLSIEEPHFQTMVEVALGKGRLLGVLQPTVSEEVDPVAPLYQVGCLGRIVSFSEGEDGRFLIGLQGVSRFRVQEELALQSGFRRVRPLWREYHSDLAEMETGAFDRARLLVVLDHYFKAYEIEADWNSIQETEDEALIASLAMICPLESSEKQALLEARDTRSRAEMLMTLLEMASLPQGEFDCARH